MNVWSHIDDLRAKHERLLRDTRAELDGLAAVKNSLRTDEYGWWTCRYVPKGERHQLELRARGATELVGLLRGVREREEK